jgi:hypothetical protein
MNEPEIRITKENGKLNFDYYPDMDSVINKILKEPDSITAKIIETPLTGSRVIRRASLKQKANNEHLQINYSEDIS